jgi:hypothetical protein
MRTNREGVLVGEGLCFSDYVDRILCPFLLFLSLTKQDNSYDYI